MWYKNFNSYQMQELLSKSYYILHKIHSHSHLILDPESAYYDDFERGFAPSEMIVKCRFRIQDQVAVAVDFYEILELLDRSSYIWQKLKFLYSITPFTCN